MPGQRDEVGEPVGRPGFVYWAPEQVSLPLEEQLVVEDGAGRRSRGRGQRALRRHPLPPSRHLCLEGGERLRGHEARAGGAAAMPR